MRVFGICDIAFDIAMIMRKIVWKLRADSATFYTMLKEETIETLDPLLLRLQRVQMKNGKIYGKRVKMMRRRRHTPNTIQ